MLSLLYRGETEVQRDLDNLLKAMHLEGDTVEIHTQAAWSQCPSCMATMLSGNKLCGPFWLGQWVAVEWVCHVCCEGLQEGRDSDIGR
jgi:hypothetical protein